MGYYVHGRPHRIFGTRSEAIRLDLDLKGTAYTEEEPNSCWAWNEGHLIEYHSRGTPEGYEIPIRAHLHTYAPGDTSRGKMATSPALKAGDAVSWPEEGGFISHGLVKEIYNDGSILTEGGTVILTHLASITPRPRDALKKGWKVAGSVFTFATEGEAQFLAKSYQQEAVTFGGLVVGLRGVVPCDVLEYDYFIWADPKTGALLNSTQGYLPPYVEDEWSINIPAHRHIDKSKPATFNYYVKHFKTKAEADFYNGWAKEGCPGAVGVHSPSGSYYLVWDYIHNGQINWGSGSDSRSGALPPPSSLDWVVRVGPTPRVEEPSKVPEVSKVPDTAGIGKGTFLALALGVLSLSLLAKKKPSRVRVLPELQSSEVELERAEGVLEHKNSVDNSTESVKVGQ